MLINALHPEELRIAIVSGNKLENFQIEAAEAALTRGNIYRGTVATLQPSLNAAFIDFGESKNGFLSLDNVVPQTYHRKVQTGKRVRIEDVLERGKPILVQVSREAEGQKGAALTTNLSLAGRYLVFSPWDDSVGVSRKVEDEDTRRELRDLAEGLKIPEGGGVIVRTNAAGQNKTAISRDLQSLLRLWKQIQSDAKQGSGPRLLQSDQDLILRALRDYLDASIEEILIDDEEAFEKAGEYVRTMMPRSRTRLVRYEERAPLFSRYDLEPQIDRIYERSVGLAGGGSIVIDRTEALTAIDVNSGRSKGGASHEETVLATNLEAASEVARQIQLRDIGGLIVVDFIDMKNPRNRRKLEAAVKDSLKADKARTTVGRISPNGLLEINRQKIRQALMLRTHRACPTCAGTGRIASPEMVSLNLLRRIEARATTVPISRARISLHPELADFFQNSRRSEIAAIEQEFGLRIEVISASHLHRPEQEIEWFERPASEDRRPAEPAAAPAAAPSPGQPHPAEEGGRKKRRRRRRRGQADGAVQVQPEIEPPQGIEATEFTVPAGGEDDEPHVEHDPAALAETEAARKRRRRRRRRGRGEGAPATDGHETHRAAGEPDEMDEPGGEIEHDAAMSPPSQDTPAAGPAHDGPRSRRRRGRRGGRGRAGGVETPAAEDAGTDAPWMNESAEPAGEPESFWTETAGEAPAPARPRRSRRRAAPRPAAAKPDSDDEAPS